jgi:endonuclease III
VSRIERLLKSLRTFYGRLPGPPRDPFSIFVWEMLSVHSTPRRRDLAFNQLKRLRVLTPDSMWRAPVATLEPCVGAVGPYVEQRMQRLRTGAEIFRRSPDLPDRIRSSVATGLKAVKPLPQMSGDGGAYRMLLFAADHAVLPVDARLARTALRLGYGEVGRDFTRTARSIRQAVAGELAADADAYRPAYLYLSHHGGMTCTEADPHCAVCPLAADCPHAHTANPDVS